MLILGLDTAGRTASAALCRDGATLRSAEAAGPTTTVLAPMVAEILALEGLVARDLELVAVARGPGSYTGLRVGVVTAKALGRAAGASVVGVPTLEAMAARAPGDATAVRVVLGAYKRKVVSASFHRAETGILLADGPAALGQAEDLVPPTEPMALVTDVRPLLAGLARFAAVVDVTGPGGASVASLGRARLAAGAIDETYSLTPDYVRPPSITLRGGGAR